jgi:hypothetical protein
MNLDYSPKAIKKTDALRAEIIQNLKTKSNKIHMYKTTTDFTDYTDAI